ncbi:hypothetical protein OB2597_01682 [Pseudooceanicola batsensis HTCC2597]|uniref:Uncharacterized protein n=1 Tax=Pseudooceanicola batsensis (strain ATCC BAA-863 / DSM 15984 / KCTC 12145 / HTCC2597) TaxID=252305 RepID=A3TWT0_PSEBH|nr:hypothetical protein OB2597_01682 [Pseudooceanicola batsensis HTCC2597]
MIDSDQKPVLGNAEFLRHQFPGKGDGLGLEIVAEAEISQHFKEGMVPGGIAHIVEVVVLAAGADAFLGGGGARIVAGLDPGEKVLELHHAGVREHQGGVVAGDERARRDDLVSLPLEIVQKGRTDVVQALHVGHLGRREGRASVRPI